MSLISRMRFLLVLGLLVWFHSCASQSQHGNSQEGVWSGPLNSEDLAKTLGELEEDWKQRFLEKPTGGVTFLFPGLFTTSDTNLVRKVISNQYPKLSAGALLQVAFREEAPYSYGFTMILRNSQGDTLHIFDRGLQKKAP